MNAEIGKQTALRIRPSDLAEIDRRAATYGIKRSEYMIRASLETLPAKESTTERLEAIEKRLDRLERATGLD